ncbi:MAG: ABC transporter permease [Corynebacterium sp.]|nr:ABC transporter permease [Corynebacterium sp.]
MKDWKISLGAALGLMAMLALMFFAFMAPATASGAKNLPLAVNAPAAVVEQLEAAGTFTITETANSESATSLVENHEAIGGISIDATGATIVTAQAAGSPYVTAMKTVGSKLEAQGIPVSYQEVAPYSDKDPSGIGMTLLAMPLALGGGVAGMIFTMLPGRRWVRAAMSVVASIGFGFIITAMLTGYGTISGHFLATAAALSFGIASIALWVQGMGALLGRAGAILAGPLFLLLLSNPLSALSTGKWWLPSGWGEFGQWLPIGAIGNMIRSINFFPGASITNNILAMLIFLALGAAGLAIGSRKQKAAAPATA